MSERDPFLQYKPELPPRKPIEATAVVPEEPPFDPQTAIASIRLDATVLGARRLAVINGTVHDEGAVVVLDKLPDVQCQLLRVLAGEIVVKIEQETFHIGSSHRAKAATEPAPTTKTEAGTSQELGAGLPEGTPLPDDLDRAVAASFAQQARSTNDDHLPSAAEADITDADHEDEECDYELEARYLERRAKRQVEESAESAPGGEEIE